MFTPRIQSEDPFSNYFMPDKLANSIRKQEDMNIDSRINNQNEDIENIKYNKFEPQELIPQIEENSHNEFLGFPTFEELKQKKISDLFNKDETDSKVDAKPETKSAIFYEKNKKTILISGGVVVVALISYLIYKKHTRNGI